MVLKKSCLQREGRGGEGGGRGRQKGRRTSGSVDMHVDVHAVYVFCHMHPTIRICMCQNICVWVTFAISPINWRVLQFLSLRTCWPLPSFYKVRNNNNGPFIQDMHNNWQSYFCGVVEGLQSPQSTCKSQHKYCSFDIYHTSNSRECMGVNGEALQLHPVYKKLYF